MTKSKQKMVRKGFWLFPTLAKLIEKEAKKEKINESALMRHIINSWFQK